MYIWKIEIVLKSGKILTTTYKGDQSSSGAVANLFLSGPTNEAFGFMDATGKHNILVLRGEIAAIDISCAEDI